MPKHILFVYGTLMKGQRNHDRFLGNSEYTGTAMLSGYALYDLGSYPAIYPLAAEQGEVQQENGLKSDMKMINPANNPDAGAPSPRGASAVKGELYLVDERTLREIHALEGEGSLYHYREVTVLDETRCAETAGTYVFATDCSGAQRVPVGCQPWQYGWQRDLVWYACYGSNLLEERFLHYLQGGICRFNGREYTACRNPSPPMDSLPFSIPFDMCFGNRSNSWGHGGVSFLDASRPGEAFGRVYLITRE